MLETLCGILLERTAVVVEKKLISRLNIFLGIKYDPDSTLVAETHGLYV